MKNIIFLDSSAPQPQSNNAALQQSSCNHQYNCECNTETCQSNSDPSGSQHVQLKEFFFDSKKSYCNYNKLILCFSEFFEPYT